MITKIIKALDLYELSDDINCSKNNIINIYYIEKTIIGSYIALVEVEEQ